MSLHHDAAIGIAIFQMTALPIALLIPAWLIYPSRKERAAAAQATEEERKSLDHSRRAGRKLLIPPLAYFGSGALSYALFRHLRGQDPTHWLTSTFKRTALPFVIAALFLAGMGAAMSAYAPDAHSVGQFVKQAQRRQGA